MTKSTLFAFCFFVFASVTVFTQTPVQIDVTSLTFSLSRDSQPGAFFSMEATGLPAPFSSPLTGRGEALFYQLEECTAGRIGGTFSTSFGSETGTSQFVSGFYPSGTTGNTRVRFTLIGTSSDLVLNPRLSQKKNPVTLRGQTTIIGKIEILDQGGVVAIDNDVNLSGSVSSEFWNYRAWSSTTQSYRRAFDYKSISFTYSR
jgi:hypothetical protein